MRHVLFCIIALTILTSKSNAYNHLRILNPQSWGSDIGTINYCNIHVQPKGLYVQYDMILSFSAKNTYYSEGDSLEVELMFDLPEGAIVNDSWLMINDSIVPADLIDRWTANAIYEGIVKRRKDPSILFKHSSTSYELRIYPIVKSEDRIAGISYLLPVDWNTNSIQTVLPFELLNTSSRDVPVDLSFPPDLEEDKVHIGGIEMDLKSTPETEFFGPAKSLQTLYSRKYNGNPTISFKSPMENGIYLTKTEYKGEGYYQLAMLPSAVLDMKSKEKLMILLDYDVSRTTFDKKELIDQVKNQLHTYSFTDSFMLYYSDVTAKAIHQEWIACDSATIEKELNAIENEIGNYSALPSLLIAGTEFIANNGNDGKIVLIGTSDQAGDYKIANSILKDLKEITTELPPFYIADLANTRVNYYYQGGNHYYGNEYLYVLLSRQSKGNLVNHRNSGSLDATIAEVFQSSSGLISTIDLYTTLDDGFCYGRYFNSSIDQGIYMHQPVTQLGKYIGNFPFEINFSGVYNEQPFSFKKVLGSDIVTNGDSTLSNCWTGRFIDALERQAGSTESVHEIISYSMENRILSKYTAFLALEPGMEVNLNEENDDDIAINVEKNAIGDDNLNIKAFPNPFKDKITIRFDIPEDVASEQIVLRIYNITGQLVKEVIVPKGMSGREFSYVWDDSGSENGVTAGQYVVVVTGPGFSKTLNVVRE